jgi:hypothetical protein
MSLIEQRYKDKNQFVYHHIRLPFSSKRRSPRSIWFRRVVTYRHNLFVCKCKRNSLQHFAPCTDHTAYKTPNKNSWRSRHIIHLFVWHTISRCQATAKSMLESFSCTNRKVMMSDPFLTSQKWCSYSRISQHFVKSQTSLLYNSPLVVPILSQIFQVHTTAYYPTMMHLVLFQPTFWSS